MDIATLLGLILGFGAIIAGQLLEGGHLNALLQPTAAVIVLGGTCGATLVSFPLKVILRALGDAKTALLHNEEDHFAIIQLIASYANMARRSGLLGLEVEIDKTEDRFIRKGLTLLVDGTEAMRFKEVMEIEINSFEETSRLNAEVFEAAGGFAPTIGIIGAVLGLIHVMNNLNDIANLGAGIAVAFVATIYGLMTANLVCIPIGTKLKQRMKEKILLKEIIFEGFLAILHGDNPRLIIDKLQGFYAATTVQQPVPREASGAKKE
jgi:chemotaxis protein MotA